MGFKCGIVGLPNVGKSTLMNHLLRQKLAITSRKPQTTRRTMLGVDTEDQCQAIYVDTPGIHEPGDRELNRYMVKEATSILGDVDLLVLVVEHSRWTDEDQLVAERIRAAAVPCIVAMNKVDQLRDKSLLLPAMQRLEGLNCFMNPLNRFPDELFELRSLDTLAWGLCGVAELPEAIGELRALRYFTCMGTKLAALPERFCELESLVADQFYRDGAVGDW